MPEANPSSAARGEILDVAVVGAGAAGAYTAYRLGKDWNKSKLVEKLMADGGHDRPKIRVFDALNRTGGRLWSYRFPGGGDLVAELGGQGYSTLMRNMYGLAGTELGLDVVACPCFNNHLFQYLRSSRFLPEALNDPNNFIGTDSTNIADKPIRYFVRDDEKKSPDALLVERFLKCVPAAKPAYDAVIAALGSKEDPVKKALPMMTALWSVLRYANLQSSHNARRYETPNESGFWNWMMEEFSSEAYQLNLDSTFTTSFDRNYNLYDTMVGYFAVLFAYYTETAFWTIKDGYDRVPKAMIEAFQKDGGDLALDTRVKCVRVETQPQDGKRLIALDVQQAGGEVETVYARSVVLALPKLALARLARQGDVLDTPEFLEKLNTVDTTPASKLFLMFEDAWWKSALPEGCTQDFGFATTDLPMKAAYYVGEDTSAKRALLLASLSDAANSSFWNGYMDDHSWGPFLHATETPQPDLGAPDQMISEMMDQLNELHFGTVDGKVPPPIDQAFQDWMRYPYEGAWHLWHPGIKSWDVIPAIRNPVDGLNLFICGEAYSTLQGWAEGAVNTAERMLEDHFGLPRAAWIDDDYDLGP